MLGNRPVPGEKLTMAFRFRTRLTIWVTLLLTVTIAIMSGVLLTVASGYVFSRYFNQGRIVTALAARNVELGIRLPERVLATVGEQMVVSSLLTGELVALAEAEGYTASEISAKLQRVIDRSRAVRGYPLVDEFWITDEHGKAYIHTSPEPFEFAPDPQGESQAEVFLDLLEPGATPIIQDLQARSLDGKPFMYAGSAGVDQPRIVQLGVSTTLVDSVRSDYKLSEVLEGFMNDMDVVRIAVVGSEGETMAALGQPLNPGEALVDGDVREFCRAYLRNPTPEGFSVKEMANLEGNRYIGVVTRIPAGTDNEYVALFMQYQTAGLSDLLQFTVRVIVYVGISLLVAGFVLSLWLGRRLSLPLGQLTTAVQSFGHGDLGKRVRIKRAYKEVHALESTFNTMADRIQSYTKELEEATASRERLESEMRIGAEVQRSLLPEGPPSHLAFDIAGCSMQAREVGGDFFDYIERKDGAVGFAIGDATDKGLPAALLTSQCASMFHVLAEGPESPSQVLDQTNRALCQKIASTGRFVTAFLAYMDGNSGRLHYATAGHNPPLLLRIGGTIDRLDKGSGLPLGVMTSGGYDDFMVEMAPGDVLLLYSDGITEAMDGDGQLYTEDRLSRVLSGQSAKKADSILKAVLDDVQRHANGAEPSDDITLVVVRYLGVADSGVWI